MRPGRFLSAPLATLALSIASATCALSCATDFDTSRDAPVAKTTLGEELYTGLCDRVGAGAFAEDLSGASYRSVCHKGASGWGSAKVATAVLPKASAALAGSRRLSIAKVEALGARREQLIEAFDTLFPDTTIPDPFHPDDKSKAVRLHDALDVFARRLTPLYESSPYSTKTATDPPLLPHTTQVLGALMATLAEGSGAQQSLAHMAGREGYRPVARSPGALRPLLAYPGLRGLLTLLLDRVGPGGPMEAPFQHLLRVAEQELRTLQPDPAQAALAIDDARLQPNRPRQKLEILSSIFLSQNAAYSRGSVAPRYLAARDLRGFVLPVGGSVAAPFRDADGDGSADVDLLGRFVGQDGTPILAPPPFATPHVLFGDGYSFDEDSRALSHGQLVYRYVDTSQSMLWGMLTDVRTLAATQNPADPSTLMRTLEGAYLLYGGKKTRKAEYPAASADSSKIRFDYESFDASGSALLDLTHATGQLLGAPESDDFIGSVLALHEQHPEKTARALQLAWSIWNKSKDPAYAAAVLADTSPFWDDLTDLLAKIARIGPAKYTGGSAIPQPRGLLSDMTLALASPAALQYLPAAFKAPMVSSDRINYHPDNVNGPPINTTTGVLLADKSNPFKTAVDRSKPDTGDNRSAFQRFAHIIGAANHVNTCNKQGAQMKAPLAICGFDLPDTVASFVEGIITSPYNECDLLQINDLGVFFLDSTLAFDHPRRARMVVKDTSLLNTLGQVNNLLKPFGKVCELTLNGLLHASTNLDGVSTTPTPQGLMRLVFFGAEGTDVPSSVLDPLIGGKNKQINTFISNLLEPTGTTGCPKDSSGVNHCASYAQTLRGIEPGTFFLAETPYLASHPPECKATCDKVSADDGSRDLCLAECAGPTSGFFEGIRPLLTAFSSYSYDPEPGEKCAKDPQGRCLGEQLFLDLMVLLDKHWSTQTSGISRYEDLVGWVLADSDLFGTVGDLVPTMRDLDYTSARVKNGQKRSPLEVTNSLVSYLFDQGLAGSLGIRDRVGSTTTTRNDGSPKDHLTPYDLLVQSLRRFDAQFDAAGDPDRKARWKAARSELVDQFLLANNGTWTNPVIDRSLLTIGRTVREQVNANCPDRETSLQCSWARDDLATKLQTTLEGPLFAAINDMTEALRGDDEARLALEKLVAYLLETASDPDSFSLLLTTLGDLLQVLADDGNLAPILNTLSPAVAPSLVKNDKTGELEPAGNLGVTPATLRLLKVLLDDRADLSPAKAEEAVIDRYHVLDRVLPQLVTPPAPDKQIPLTVIIDTIAAVQRFDSSDPGPLSADDYRATATGLRSFLVDDYRGLEQFYTIVRGRRGD
jgi:hypothetical protein